MSSTTMLIFEGVNLLHFPNLLRPAQGPKGAANQVENLPVFFSTNVKRPLEKELVVSTHLKNISQNGSFPQGSG